MTPASAVDIQVADLRREAADWTPVPCCQVAGVFHGLMAYGEVLTLKPMRQGAQQRLMMAQAKEASP
jgi:hypothetical protein